jgi:hypothetical protein
MTAEAEKAGVVLAERLGDGLPLNERKQQFSLAYVRIVAAAAGFWIKCHDADYDGVDITIASSSNYQMFYGPEFELQVKCTSRDNLTRPEHLVWIMDAKPYRKLTNRKRYLPAFLGVLVVPEDANAWLDQDEERMLTRSRMYWQRAADLEELGDDQATKSVYLPRSNLFDVVQLCGIMKTIGDGGDR